MILTNKTIYYKFSLKLKEFLYKFLTKKELDIFTKGGDIISVSPHVHGFWENELNQVISFYAREGFSNFFIDIGANIGLTSCQNSNLFEHYWCFEPNPLCCKVLDVNLSISLPNKNYTIFEFGLGLDERNYHLYIPKKNWGGGFVKEDNSYSTNILTAKDNLESVSRKDYLIEKILIKNSLTELSNLFSSLSRSKKKRGFIKIDVEGYEMIILKSIAETLPEGIGIVISFENWDENCDFEELKKQFSPRKIDIKYIKDSFRDERKTSGILRLLTFGFFGKKFKTELITHNIDHSKTITGEIIIEIH